MAVSESIKIIMFDYYFKDKESILWISKTMHINRRTVTKYIRAEENKRGIVRTAHMGTKGIQTHKNDTEKTLLDKIHIVKEKQNEILLEKIMNDNRLNKAVDMILDLIVDEDTLKNELKKNGLRNLTGLLGTITDKGLKYADLQVKRKAQKEGLNISIDNNIGKIIDLMKDASEMNIDPKMEIKEFQTKEDIDD